MVRRTHPTLSDGPRHAAFPAPDMIATASMCSKGTLFSRMPQIFTRRLSVRTKDEQVHEIAVSIVCK